MPFIDKGHFPATKSVTRGDYSAAVLYRFACSFFDCSRADDCKKKMSALQTFLLVVDHNKEEAKEIAERVAHGECSAVQCTSYFESQLSRLKKCWSLTDFYSPCEQVSRIRTPP